MPHLIQTARDAQAAAAQAITTHGLGAPVANAFLRAAAAAAGRAWDQGHPVHIVHPCPARSAGRSPTASTN